MKIYSQIYISIFFIYGLNLYLTRQEEQDGRILHKYTSVSRVWANFLNDCDRNKSLETKKSCRWFLFVCLLCVQAKICLAKFIKTRDLS